MGCFDSDGIGQWQAAEIISIAGPLVSVWFHIDWLHHTCMLDRFFSLKYSCTCMPMCTYACEYACVCIHVYRLNYDIFKPKHLVRTATCYARYMLMHAWCHMNMI